MTNRELRIWLLGFFELSNKPLDRKMIFIIKNHLNLVKAVQGSLDETNQMIYDKIKELFSQNLPPEELALFQQRLPRVLEQSL